MFAAVRRSRLVLLAASASLLLLVVFLWLGARPVGVSLTRPDVPAHARPEIRGAAAFQGADFGGISLAALSTNAVPWRLVAAALVLDEMERDPRARLEPATLDRTLSRFGFLVDPEIVNQPPKVERRSAQLPLGFTGGNIAPLGGSVVRIANLGCAACHAGVTYEADGSPNPNRVMLGMPNSSIDLEAYTKAVFQAIRRHVDSDRLLPAAQALFPDMGWRERTTLRLLVLPLARRRIEALEGADRPLPFPNGSPGSTNGVAALKAALGLPLAGGGEDDSAIVSIPDLGDRIWKTSLLVDGAYAIPGKPRQRIIRPADLGSDHLRALAAITTFFTVPSMGVHPDQAFSSLSEAMSIMAFLKAYRPQPFPGRIDKRLADRGASLYRQVCASCHGTYSSGPDPRLIEYPNWIGDVGTDRLRADLFDDRLVDGVNRTLYAGRIAVARGASYVAPPLSGIWASAPYLHNGSVPTLEALLSPDRRPARFQVGGHALDFGRVGLRLEPDGRYPASHRPFSGPAWTDTGQPGLGNQGHDQGSELPEADKKALLEFLKQL